MTDWNLVSKALLGINWITECNKVENIDKTLREVWGKNFAENHNGERLLNTGVLMMAAYILFVYPRENYLDDINFDLISIDDFKIISQDNNNDDSKTLCTRLRNSVAHGNYTVSDVKEEVTFRDERQNGTNKIEFKIHIVKFGKFITNFAFEVNQQIINKEEN